MNEWINKRWYSHIMQYYLTTKRMKYWFMLQWGWTLKVFCFVKDVSHQRLTLYYSTYLTGPFPRRGRHDLLTEQQWWTFPVVMPIINCHGTCEYVFQFSPVTQSCLTLWDSMDCSTPGLHIHYQLLEFTQAHVHRAGDAIQPSHPLLSPSPPAFNLSQHQGPFWWVSSSHQVAKVLEFQLQHQSFQWIFRTDLL